MYSSRILMCQWNLTGEIKWFSNKLSLQVPSLSQFLPILYLPEGFELGLHYEVILAELATAGVWALDPLVEAGLVDKAQSARAAAGGDEGALFIPFAVTDPGEDTQPGWDLAEDISHWGFPPLPIWAVLETATQDLEPMDISLQLHARNESRTNINFLSLA